MYIALLLLNACTGNQSEFIEIDLAELSIATDPLPDSAVRIRIREIAVSKKLTFYDAAYVELAQRLQLPLKSFDRRIQLVMS